MESVLIVHVQIVQQGAHHQTHFNGGTGNGKAIYVQTLKLHVLDL